MEYQETKYYKRLTETDEQKNEAKLAVAVDKLKNDFRVSLNTEKGLLIDAQEALKTAKSQTGKGYSIPNIKESMDGVAGHEENIEFIKNLYKEEFGEELV